MPKTMKTTKQSRPTGKRTRTPPAAKKTTANKTTVGTRFVGHVRTTKWYRSKLADRIPKRRKALRVGAHLAFGVMKIAGYAVAGAGVGAIEGGRRVSPVVRRHIKRHTAPKWNRHHAKVERQGPWWRVQHTVTCVCGETFHDTTDLNKHYSEKHRDETRVFPKHKPTIHPTYTRRAAGKVKVRPVPNAPTGRHRTHRSTAGHHKASAMVAAARKRVEERGKKVMADGTSTAARVGRAWAEIGDTVPRGTDDVMDIISGLAQAASARGEALEQLQLTLIKRLNVDPLVAKGLDPVIALAEAEVAAFTAVWNTIETIYGPYLALLRSGVAVPNS
jgi:hypothetical protein